VGAPVAGYESRHRPSVTSATVILIVLAFASTVISVDAAAAHSSRRPATFSLTITPARLVIPPSPGSLTRSVTATNSGSTALDVNVTLSGFRQQPDGTIIFDKTSRTDDGSGWITTRPNSFHLAPGQAKKVRLSIDVPAHAEPGDHSVGLIFLVPADKSKANLTLNRGVGAEILLRAPGQVIHDITLENLDVPALSMGGELPLTLTLHDSGNVHEDYFAPTGQVVAKTASTRIAFPDFTVLAGVTRTVKTTWPSTPWFCHCTLAVTVPNGHGGTSTVNATVWILPVKQAASGLLMIVGLVLLIRWRRHRRQSALSAAREEGYAAAQLSSH
jgi:hypothetical protein